MTTLYHSIIGLPRSGKTTFLAALWHLIDAGEVETKLVLDRLVGDHKYLNRIVEAWRRCEKTARTARAAETIVSIHLREPLTGRNIVLEFPDLSGESFEDQYTSRACKADYVKGFSREGGILLFINADKSQDGMTLLDLGPEITVNLETEQPTDEQGGPQEKPKQDWSAKLMPEQVRLVELLQFLLTPPFERRRRRLAVGVSAWDVIDNRNLTPNDWLARELPFFYQFIHNNTENFEVRVYGISAQGGDVTGDRRSELAQQTPSKRIQCVGPNADPHDLTAPLLWLSSGD